MIYRWFSHCFQRGESSTYIYIYVYIYIYICIYVCIIDIYIYTWGIFNCDVFRFHFGSRKMSPFNSHSAPRPDVSQLSTSTQPGKKFDIYIYIYMYVYIYVIYPLWVHLCTYMSIHVHICPYMSIYVYECPYMSMNVHICPHLFSNIVKSQPTIDSLVTMVAVFSANRWLSMAQAHVIDESEQRIAPQHTASLTIHLSIYWHTEKVWHFQQRQKNEH